MYLGDIPFHPKTGDQVNYPENRYGWEYHGTVYDSHWAVDTKFGKGKHKDGERVIIPYDWRPNAPFKTKMEIRGLNRGRSAANFTLRDDASKEYTIFMVDLLGLLQKHSIVKGWTEELTWSFCKKGESYGVKLHDEQL